MYSFPFQIPREIEANAKEPATTGNAGSPTSPAANPPAKTVRRARETLPI